MYHHFVQSVLIRTIGFLFFFFVFFPLLYFPQPLSTGAMAFPPHKHDYRLPSPRSIHFLASSTRRHFPNFALNLYAYVFLRLAGDKSRSFIRVSSRLLVKDNNFTSGINPWRNKNPDHKKGGHSTGLESIVFSIVFTRGLAKLRERGT